MSRRTLCLAALVVVTASACAQTITKRQGYVTAIAGAQEFSLDNHAVQCNEQTRLVTKEKDAERSSPMVATDLAMGEHVQVEGHLASGEYIADRVRIVPTKGRAET